jgi:hypothetical protein
MQFNRVFAFVFLYALAIYCVPGCADEQVKLGKTERREPPSQAETSIPKSDERIPKVNLRAFVVGEFSKADKRNLYVLVCPISNPVCRSTWWVQELPDRRDDRYCCSCQFGEGDQGVGEYFAIVMVATEKNLDVGRQFQELPDDMAYSPVAIVKRTR